MMLESPLMMLFATALGLGLLHAFDSDHLLAVANLMAQKSGYRKALGYSLHWAFGHGLVLILLGLYASYLGLSLPHFVSHWAEYLVGIMLVILGVWTLYQWYHDTFIPGTTVPRTTVPITTPSPNIATENEHALIQKDSRGNEGDETRRSPILVGIIHGCAGSAPVLALIPAIQLKQPVITLSYMLLFAVGVLLSMSLFAFAFSYSHQSMQRNFHQGFQVIRLMLGIFAIGLGLFWLQN